jgi:endo-1,4-beta-xylanase
VITVKTSDGSEKTGQCNVTVGYSITYQLNGGTNTVDNPATYTGTSKIKLNVPNKGGYTFAGWYTDKACKKQIKAINKGSKKNITVYAKWTKIKVEKPSINQLTNKKTNKLSLKYGKVSGAKGYEVVYATDKKFAENSTVITVSKPSSTITGLEKGKKYYVKVRAYKEDSTGNKVYGKYSSVKKITIKK